MNENPGMKRQPRRRSMQLKLNALVIGNILAVALGLMAISYYVFVQRVDDKMTRIILRSIGLRWHAQTISPRR